jgi:hypothetical protein
MAAQSHAVDVPPVEVVLSEVVANLAMLAHAYVEPPVADGAEPAAPDFASAGIALDVAGAAFERIEPRLDPQQRAAVARLLTESRLSYVKKRGS